MHPLFRNLALRNIFNRAFIKQNAPFRITHHSHVSDYPPLRAILPVDFDFGLLYDVILLHLADQGKHSFGVYAYLARDVGDCSQEFIGRIIALHLRKRTVDAYRATLRVDLKDANDSILKDCSIFLFCFGSRLFSQLSLCYVLFDRHEIRNFARSR